MAAMKYILLMILNEILKWYALYNKVPFNIMLSMTAFLNFSFSVI